MSTVMTSSEALARFGESAVRHRLAIGNWQRPCRGVVVTHSGPPSPAELREIALASSPPRSALGGPTALVLDGFEGFDSDRIHVVVPGARRHPNLNGVVVHVSNELSDLDVHPQRTPRRTRPARSVLDFASWQSNERRARAIVIAAVQQGIVTTQLLREALLRRGPCRHRALIRECMADADGGVQSLPERDFGDIWHATGVGPLTRQRKVRRADGSYFLDAYCDEFGFGIEIHGAPHLAVERWDRDLMRANEIALRGERLLFFSSYAIRHAPQDVAHQIVAMARSQGWPGITNDVAIQSLGRRNRNIIRR